LKAESKESQGAELFEARSIWVGSPLFEFPFLIF
jgi:hypothetical protein